MTNPEAKLTTAEAAAEFKRLYGECIAAIAYANTVLQSDGMESESFLKADRNARAVWQRLREVQGLATKHWLA